MQKILEESIPKETVSHIGSSANIRHLGDVICCLRRCDAWELLKKVG